MSPESPDPVQFPNKCWGSARPGAQPAHPRPGTTSTACAERPTGPRSSYTVDAATPTAPGPRKVSATRQSHSPTGGRSTCTVSSVLRKAQVSASTAADTPEAESTQ